MDNQGQSSQDWNQQSANATFNAQQVTQPAVQFGSGNQAFQISQNVQASVSQNVVPGQGQIIYNAVMPSQGQQVVQQVPLQIQQSVKPNQLQPSFTTQAGNVRQVVGQTPNQGIRLQQVAGNTNIIRVLNPGGQQGQVMLRGVQTPGSIRLTQTPQNSAIRIAPGSNQSGQAFVISNPASQTGQIRPAANNMGQIRILNLGSNTLASAGVQLQSVPQGQTVVAGGQGQQALQLAATSAQGARVSPAAGSQPLTLSQETLTQLLQKQKLLTQKQQQPAAAADVTKLNQRQLMQIRGARPQQIVVQSGTRPQFVIQQPQQVTSAVTQVNAPTGNVVIATQAGAQFQVAQAQIGQSSGAGQLGQTQILQNVQMSTQGLGQPSAGVVSSIPLQTVSVQSQPNALQQNLVSIVSQPASQPSIVQQTPQTQVIVTSPYSVSLSSASSNQVIIQPSITQTTPAAASSGAGEQSVVKSAPTVVTDLSDITASLSASSTPQPTPVRSKVSLMNIPAQIQKMSTALQRIIQTSNTPENQPKIKEIQVRSASVWTL